MDGTSPMPAGTPGPHVFVESLDRAELAPDDVHHLRRALRLRDGDSLSVSDACGSWARGRLGADDRVDLVMDPLMVPEPKRPVTVAFSLTKAAKPELAMQKLTELGVSRIVVLSSDRSVVRWDAAKVDAQRVRFDRIVREAGMQSHRVRLPAIDLLVDASEWLVHDDVFVAHFDGAPLQPSTVQSVAIGPEGGWSDGELALAKSRTVTLGSRVLRAETAAIAAASLLLLT